MTFARLQIFSYILMATSIVIFIACLDKLYESQILTEEEVTTAYEQFKKTYHKNYLTKTENTLRYQIFYSNYKLIKLHNAKPNENFKLAINKFADLTEEEFTAMYLGLKTGVYNSEETLRKSFRKPTSLQADLDFTGNLLPPKDQGTCGSCWTFCTVGAVEALYSIKKSAAPISFSEQFLVDCDITQLSHGCNGGEMVDAFAFMATEGVVLGKDYPYMAMDMTCQNSTKPKFSWKPTSQGKVTPNDNDALFTQLSNGPISIALNAASYYFRYFSSGTF